MRWGRTKRNKRYVRSYAYMRTALRREKVWWDFGVRVWHGCNMQQACSWCPMEGKVRHTRAAEHWLAYVSNQLDSYIRCSRKDYGSGVIGYGTNLFTPMPSTVAEDNARAALTRLQVVELLTKFPQPAWLACLRTFGPGWEASWRGGGLLPVLPIRAWIGLVFSAVSPPDWNELIRFSTVTPKERCRFAVINGIDLKHDLDMHARLIELADIRWAVIRPSWKVKQQLEEGLTHLEAVAAVYRRLGIPVFFDGTADYGKFVLPWKLSDSEGRFLSYAEQRVWAERFAALNSLMLYPSGQLNGSVQLVVKKIDQRITRY